MRYGMSYIHETVWNGVPKFLRRVDTALKNIGINERLPYDVPLIKFCSWMGGDRDGIFQLTFFNKVAGALYLSIKRETFPRARILKYILFNTSD
jgi:phosphoenolpyruvate carboxylase